MGIAASHDTTALWYFRGSHNIGIDWVNIVIGAVVHECELQRAQGHVVLKHEGGVLWGEGIGCLAFLVQFYFLALVHCHQSVVDNDLSTVQVHNVQFAQRAIVFVVFLASRQQHGY